MSRLKLAGCWAALVLAVSLARADEPLPKAPVVDLYGDPLPEGAKARLGTVRFRAGEHLQAMAFTADGKQVITANLRGPIRFWDAATGRLVRSVPKGSEDTQRFVFSTDGRTAVSLGRGYDETEMKQMHSLRRWDLETGKMAWSVSDENEIGANIFLSGDGTRLALILPRDKLAIWDAIVGIPLKTCVPPRHRGLGFSPDGSQLILVNHETLHGWDWTSEEAPRLLAAHAKPAFFATLAHSSDGKKLAALDVARRELLLIDTVGGKRLGTLELPDWKQTGYALALSPDGRRLATAWSPQESELLIWEPDAGMAPTRLSLGGLNANFLVFAPDSTRIAVANRSEGTIGVWNVKIGQRLVESAVAHQEPPQAMTVVAGGKQLVTGSPDGLVCAWDTATQKPLWHYRHGRAVGAGAFINWGSVVASPDGKYVASTGFDGTVRVVDAASGRESHRLPGYEQNAGSAVFLDDGQRLATCDGVFKLLRVWDLKTGKKVAEHALSLGDGAENVRSYAFSGDGRRLGMANEAHVHLFDVESGREVMKTRAPWFRFAFRRDATRFVVWQSDPNRTDTLADGTTPRIDPALVQIYDAETGKLFRELEIPTAGLGELAFSPDGALVVAGSREVVASSKEIDNLIVVWQVESGEELVRFRCGNAFPTSLAISPDNKTLFSGMSDTSALVWDLP